MPEYLAPGVYVEEVSFRSKSIEGVSTSTAAFVGPTRKGPLSGTPEVITSFGDFERIYGGLTSLSFAPGQDSINYLAHAVNAFFANGGARLYVARTFMPRNGLDGIARATVIAGDAANQAAFVARERGAGYNGSVVVSMKRTKTSEKLALDAKSVPIGSLLRTGGDNPALPARLKGGTPPFSLGAGGKLALTINGGAPQEITLTGTPAEVTGDAVADPANVPVAAGLSLTVTFKGKPAQTIALPAETRSLADWAGFLNAKLVFGHARVANNNQLVIASDLRGSAVQTTVNALPALGFNPVAPATAIAATGAGNVANLDAVTYSELLALLTAAGVAVDAAQDPATGQLVLSTKTTGKAGAKLQVHANTAKDVQNGLGLAAGEVTGEDGAAVLFYYRAGGGWIGGADGVTPLADTTVLDTAEVITATVVVTEPDGAQIGFDEVGLSAAHPRFLGDILSKTPTRKADALLNPVAFEIGATLKAAPDLPLRLRTAFFGTLGGSKFDLTGGDDGQEPPAGKPAPAVAGAVSYQEALALLEAVDDVSILAAPGHSSFAKSNFQSIQDLLIGHCEKMKYRIAVLDTPAGLLISEAQDVRSRIDSTRAALYYPWVVVANPAARPGDDRIPKEIALPPSGFVTGIYARTDIQRGVWKAPANEVVLGTLRFERDITHGEQEVLNPQGVNCLRFFYGRGNRVWGARTATSDPEWKYVNVRRYFNYLEHSIDRSTQWAVFEPNGEALWANIRETVSAFLYNEWRSGALLGSKPEESFFVRCDRSTMTQNDLDNGRLICLIGVAPLKPAEFVIFRIGQKTADARS